jgi:hypothetical protein
VCVCVCVCVFGLVAQVSTTYTFQTGSVYVSGSRWLSLVTLSRKPGAFAPELQPWHGEGWLGTPGHRQRVGFWLWLVF